MPKYPFLSEEWVEEARRIYARAQANGPLVEGPGLTAARVNLVVNDAPFAAGPIQAHVDTSQGGLHIDTGHLEKPDVTVSMTYDTARSLFVAGDVQTVMQAFLSGRVRVDGDLSKLLDPRTGIWPASFGAPWPGTGAAAGNAVAPGQAPGPPGPAPAGQPGAESPDEPPEQPGSEPSGQSRLALGLGVGEDQSIAAQLQEITE